MLKLQILLVILQNEIQSIYLSMINIYENTYPAEIGITDEQGAMGFLGLVKAIKSHRCFLPITGRNGLEFSIETTDNHTVTIIRV